MDQFFGGFISVWLLLATVPIGLIVLGIVALTNRRDDDPGGQRATAIYLGVVCFLALFAVLFVGTMAVSKVASLIVPAEDRSGDSGGGWFGYSPGDGVVYSDDEFLGGGRFRPRCMPDCVGELPDEVASEINDETIRGAIWAGLVFIPAAFVLRFHLKRRRALVDREDFGGTSAWRSDRVYLYLVCTVAIVVATLAAASMLYDLLRMVAPDLTSDPSGRRSERERGLADAITMTVLALGSTVIFFAYWSQVSGEDNPLGRLRPSRRRGDDPEVEEPTG